MSKLALTSSIGIFVAGLLVFLCWVIAANDKKLAGGNAVGCIKKFNEMINELDLSLKRYYRGNQDAFVYLIAFGVICGILWMGTAVLGRINAKYYLFAGIGTTVAFICVFTSIVERLRDERLCDEILRIGSPTPDLMSDLFGTGEKILKHTEISYELFWGSSMTCFLLAAYQIGCAIAMVYEENKTIKGHQQMNAIEENPNETPVNEDASPKEEKKASVTEINLGVNTSKIEESKLGGTSVIVKKGEVIPPAESPIPDIDPNNFSMNAF
jgi:hypothetical protein